MENRTPRKTMPRGVEFGLIQFIRDNLSSITNGKFSQREFAVYAGQTLGADIKTHHISGIWNDKSLRFPQWPRSGSQSAPKKRTRAVMNMIRDLNESVSVLHFAVEEILTRLEKSVFQNQETQSIRTRLNDVHSLTTEVLDNIEELPKV